MVKVPIWAYYCMNSYVTTRARSTRVKQYCHFDNFVLLTSSGLDGMRQRGALVYLVGASLLACEVEHLACARCQLYVLYTDRKSVV